MTLILNLETASTNCSVSLARDGELLALKEEYNASYSHSEQLHLFMEAVLKEAGYTLEDIDAVAVSQGPGSYTGLRIGVSAAKGLCFALDIPLLAIATLESLARKAQVKEGVIIPMLDARRMEVYSAVFSPDYKRLRETRAEVIGPDSFKEYLENGKVHLLGAGALKCREVLRHANICWHDDILLPSAREMSGMSFSKFAGNEFEDTAYFEPFYLKDFMGNLKPKGR